MVAWQKADIWAISSVGRALRSHRRGREFESLIVHQLLKTVHDVRSFLFYIVGGIYILNLDGELDELVCGKNAHWKPSTLIRTSWTGSKIRYEPAHAPEIFPKIICSRAAAMKPLKVRSVKHRRHMISGIINTSGVTPIRMGISTIGFGLGVYKLAHMCNEYCEISELIALCKSDSGYSQGSVLLQLAANSAYSLHRPRKQLPIIRFGFLEIHRL